MESLTSRHFVFYLIGALVATAWASLFTQPARAAAVPVTNTLDGGTGSLRQAVLDAADGDAIVFDPGVYSVPLTITLTSGQIEISKSLSIDGAYGGVVTPTVTSDSFTRMLYIDAGGAPVSVTLHRLRLVNGACDGCDGGALGNNGGDVTVDSSALLGSAADAGGALWNGGTLTMTRSVLAGNRATAYAGGAIHNEGNLVLSATVVMSNSAAQGGGGVSNQLHLVQAGGQLVASGGRLTVFSGQFTGNSAPLDGGAIYNLTSDTVYPPVYTRTYVTVTGTSFLYNTADPSTGSGGALANCGPFSVMQVSHSVFAGNSAGGGGAIANLPVYDSPGGRLKVTDSLFTRNTAGAGGALFYHSHVPLDVTGSSFVSNIAGSGGAIYTDATGWFTLTNATFIGNRSDAPGMPPLVGAIWIDGGDYTHVSIVNSTVVSNTPVGLYLNGGAAAVVNTILASNGADGLGNYATAYRGSFTSLGHNLTNGTGAFTGTGDLTNTSPLLGDLGYHGGPVPTIPLLPGSPAINAGDDALCPATDARGIRRPIGPHCDIGAYEAFNRFWWMPIIQR